MKGARQDGALYSQVGQLLRISGEGSQERGDGGKRPGGGLGPGGALVMCIVVCRACRARVAIAVRKRGRLMIDSRCRPGSARRMKKIHQL